MEKETRKLTGTALLLGLMVLFQSLRLFVPIPPFINNFIIGSLVNCCLVLGLLRFGYISGITLAIIAPVIAALQGFLLSPLFILPVAMAHVAYISALWGMMNLEVHKFLIIPISALLKTTVIFSLFVLLFKMVEIPPAIQKMILFVMSWPQMITGIIGGSLAFWIDLKLKEARH